MQNYIEYAFEVTPENPWKEILIAELSEALAFESFEEKENKVFAYILENLDNEKELENVYCLGVDEVDISYTKRTIEQENWNKTWEESFSPLFIDDRLYIRATVHEPKPEAEFEIVIKPKMSFGTGHHETTHMMSQYLLEMDLKDKRIMDMGCGTAILAILSKMQGAVSVEGIDIDQWAYENAIENAERNKVEIEVQKGGAECLEKQEYYDVFLANINKNILLRDIPFYLKTIKKGGSLLLSGFFEIDFEDMKQYCIENGLVFEQIKQRNEWIAIRFTK